MTPEQRKALEKLEHVLAEAFNGLTDLEKALYTVDVLREECGGQWVLKADSNAGKFIIERTDI